MSRVPVFLTMLLASPALLAATPSWAAPSTDCSTLKDLADYNRCLGAKWLGTGGNTCAPAGNHGEIHPCEGEESHWIARPFTMPDDLEISAVRYELYDGVATNGGLTCDASLAHRVQVLIGTDPGDSGLPASNPVVAYSWNVPSESRGAGYHVVELRPEVPIQVEKGQVAFVSVQFAGEVEDVDTCADSGKSLCVGACKNSNPTWSWSNTDQTPYSWSFYVTPVEFEAGVKVRASTVYQGPGSE